MYLNISMNAALIELHYLPSLEYFCALRAFDRVIIEKHEHFVKQSYRNRCHVLTAQGTFSLTVPLRDKRNDLPMYAVKIDYTQKWQNNHWRTIESAYRNAPFFEFYAEELQHIIYKGHETLYSLNSELLSFCLRSSHMNVSLSESVAYEKIPANGILDLRGYINAKKPYSERNLYHPIPYYQVFGNAFASNLSILDLLFCMGPQTLNIINNSGLKKLNK